MTHKGSSRRGKLAADELRLLKDIAESSKAFGMWPKDPEMIPVDIAVRAAEQAYRRGVVQGAHFMLWHLHPDTRDTRASTPMFLIRLNRWRTRGIAEQHAKAEIPPSWDSPLRWKQ